MKSNTISSTAAIAFLLLALSGCAKAVDDGANQSISTSASTNTATSTATSTAAVPSSETKTASPTNAAAGRVYLGTLKGVISDSMCGKDHSKMVGATGDAKACIAKCIASGAKYVLVDSKGDKYDLSDQDKAKKMSGQQVAITGHIDPAGKSIHVHTIASASN